MWVTRERWLNDLRLKEEPLIVKNDEDRLYYGFRHHYWESVSIYDWHMYSSAPHYFGVILVCDPETGLPKRELSIQTADTPDLEDDNPVLELAEFRYYTEAYHSLLSDVLVPATVMEARIFIQNKEGEYYPYGLRRNVYSLEDESPWFPEEDEFARGPVKSWPKRLGYILEEGIYKHWRGDKWREDMRVVYEGNRLHYDSERLNYCINGEGNISDPVYLEGDEGSFLDLDKVQLSLGKSRIIRF